MRRRALAVLAALAACSDGESGVANGDSTPAAAAGIDTPTRSSRAAGIEALPVNRGTQGMRATVRWALSPDRRALVVVEDPVSVEAEALPDGFLYASERTGAVVQVDNVWDVAPSPDWSRLAFGRAYILRAGERDTVPPAEWERLEAQLPEDVAARDTRTLRRRLEAHAFPASGMAVMLGLGLAQVLWVDSLAAGRVAVIRAPTHSLHGWRVRWTPGGDTLAVGASPRLVQDDASPARWVLVRPRRGAMPSDTLGGVTDSSGFAPIAWTVGPTMELASQVDLSRGREIAIDGGVIAVRADSIQLTRRRSNGRQETVVVGPGVPLAATAGGRFIAALVPRRDAKQHEMQAYPVVYHVPPR
jgi:hypothetical protein